MSSPKIYMASSSQSTCGFRRASSRDGSGARRVCGARRARRVCGARRVCEARLGHSPTLYRTSIRACGGLFWCGSGVWHRMIACWRVCASLSTYYDRRSARSMFCRHGALFVARRARAHVYISQRNIFSLINQSVDIRLINVLVALGTYPKEESGYQIRDCADLESRDVRGSAAREGKDRAASQSAVHLEKKRLRSCL
jgi:hypothetical protein